MKNKTYSLLTAILLLTTVSLTIQAQTYVSGGIYSNTIWTFTNSPYIVTDTVVIFPNVILTIEPGVTVKFANNKVLEVRQGKIYAVGTITDSITFTSNSTSPFAGIWSKIHINGGTLISVFEYCNFEYANSGIYNHYLNGGQNSTTEVQIKHSKFYNNYEGISCIGNGGGFTKIENSLFVNNIRSVYGAQIIINGCNINNNQIGFFIAPFAFTYTYINNCIINSNQYGITGGATVGASFYSIKNSTIDNNTVAGIVQGGYSSYVDTILNCEIKNNPIGVLDSFGSGLFMRYSIIENNNIGLKFRGANKNLSCNKICNNSIFDLYYQATSSTLNVANNYWCTSDSLSTRATIYDGYVNPTYALVDFMPIDSACLFTSIDSKEIDKLLKVFPNPFSIQTIIQTDKTLNNATLIVYNTFGHSVIQIMNIFEQTITLHRNNLSSGMYFLRLTQNNKCLATGKLIIND